MNFPFPFFFCICTNSKWNQNWYRVIQFYQFNLYNSSKFLKFYIFKENRTKLTRRIVNHRIKPWCNRIKYRQKKKSYSSTTKNPRTIKFLLFPLPTMRKRKTPNQERLKIPPDEELRRPSSMLSFSTAFSISARRWGEGWRHDNCLSSPPSALLPALVSRGGIISLA